MKVRMLDWLQMELDLSEHPKEVSDYVFDQLPDRLNAQETTIREIVDEMELDSDYDKQIITVTTLVPELVQRIIEEKEADMNFEKRAAKEVLEAGYRALEESE